MGQLLLRWNDFWKIVSIQNSLKYFTPASISNWIAKWNENVGNRKETVNGY